MDSPSRPGLRRILSCVVILIAVFTLSLMGLRPPAPKSSTALPTQFSAIRALDTLHRILGADEPHPVGSPANEAVRQRILTEFTNLGYQPQVQNSFACSSFGECAAVNNVLARLDGAEESSGSDDAVLLAAHYDSVPAGPGDSDDGVGAAAVLECARALKSGPAPRHTIIFLIDEGEENGLLGALAFVNSHPWAKQVRAAVNLDARGTSGPSLMFETGSANDWAVRLYAQHATRPAASSIFYTVYQRIPNDTDFTVFKAAGYQGLNFAFIGDEVHYHTPLDNSANVTAASLQHQGENALPSVRALANSNLSAPPQREAVFFDLFGRTMIHWPARRTIWFALLAELLLLVQTGWMVRNGRLSREEFLRGLLAWSVIIVVAGVLALVLRWLIRLGGGAPVNWIAHPLPIQVAFWSLGAAVAMIGGVLFAKRARFWGLWAGVWVWCGLLAVLLAWLAPGLSYVQFVPALVAALAGLLATIPRRESTALAGLAAVLPAVASGVVAFAPAILLYDGLGDRGLPLIALVVALILTPLAPLCADLRQVAGMRSLSFLWVPVLLTPLAAFTAVVLPSYSAKSPERVDIQYWQDADSGQARWIVRPDSRRLPEAIRLAGGFRRSSEGAFPWSTRTAFLADAPSLGLSAPTFTVLDSSQENDRRTYRALLRSERGAPFAAVFFPPDVDVRDVRVGDQLLQPESPAVRSYFNGWAMYADAAMPSTGVQISFSLPVAKPVDVTAMDQAYGLPPEGEFLLKARPFTATRSQEGDVTFVTRRVELIP